MSRRTFSLPEDSLDSSMMEDNFPKDSLKQFNWLKRQLT